MNRPPPEINVKRRALVAFIGLVLGLSWLQFIPPYLEGSMGVTVPDSTGPALGAVFMVSPVVAALVTITWGAARETSVSFLRQRLRWRVPPTWYVIAFLLLPALAIIAAVVFTL